MSFVGSAKRLTNRVCQCRHKLCSCSPRVCTSRNRGFTLIELLVVVSIIALLIALLLPSLKQAKMQAKTVVCSSHIHGFMVASLSYAHDQNGYLPRDYWYDPGHEQLLPEVVSGYIGGPVFPLIPQRLDPTFWTEPHDTKARKKRDAMLAPIFKKMDILQCVAFPQWELDEVVVRDINQKENVISEQPYDYMTNAFDLNPDTAGSNPFLSHAATLHERIPTPSRLLYISEVNQYSPLNVFGYHDVWDAELQLWWGDAPRMIDDNRHGGKANVMFFDGHNETLSIREKIRVEMFTPYVDREVFKPAEEDAMDPPTGN